MALCHSAGSTHRIEVRSFVIESILPAIFGQRSRSLSSKHTLLGDRFVTVVRRATLDLAGRPANFWTHLASAMRATPRVL